MTEITDIAQWNQAVSLSRAALPQIEQHRGILAASIRAMRESGVSEDAITRMCEAYYEAEQRMKDTVRAALTGEWADPSGDDAEVYVQACTAVYADARAEAAAAIGQGAAAILIALSDAYEADAVAMAIVPGLSEADRAELLGSSYTASSIEPAGQTTKELAGPVGEGFPASSWNLPAALSPAHPLPSRPARSKNVRKRRAAAELRRRKRAAKARRA